MLPQWPVTMTCIDEEQHGIARGEYVTFFYELSCLRGEYQHTKTRYLHK